MKQTKRNDLRRLGLGYNGYPQKSMRFIFCVPSRRPDYFLGRKCSETLRPLFVVAAVPAIWKSKCEHNVVTLMMY